MSIPSAPQSFRYEGSIPKNVLDLKADDLTDSSVTLKWKPASQPGVTYNITILIDTKRWYPLLKPRSTKETEYTGTLILIYFNIRKLKFLMRELEGM